MTPLRQRMLEDMKIRRFARSTQIGHICCLGQLAKHYGRSPELLDLEEVRGFLVYLVTEVNASSDVIQNYVSAFRIFFKVTLGRPWGSDLRAILVNPWARL